MEKILSYVDFMNEHVNVSESDLYINESYDSQESEEIVNEKVDLQELARDCDSHSEFEEKLIATLKKNMPSLGADKNFIETLLRNCKEDGDDTK